MVAPRRKRYNRKQRLQIAKKWIPTYEGKNLERGYKKWFGVNFICALTELEMLGYEVDPKYKEQILKQEEAKQKAAKERKKRKDEERFKDEVLWQDENFMINSLIKVGIICSCNIEYQSCKEILNLHNETELASRLISSRREKDVEVIAVQAGPGKIQCASATQLIIDKFEPDFIFDVGASGSLSEKLSNNNIVCGEYSFEYDVCPSDNLTKIPEDLKTSIVLNKVFSKEVIKEFSNWAEENTGAIIKVGNIASGEKNVDNKEIRQELHNKLGAIACNWETSSVLKTAQLNGIKSFSFRAITDNSGEDMKDNLNANWGKALEIMFTALNKFIFEGWVNKI